MCSAWPCCERRYNVRCYAADGKTRWVRRFEAPHPQGGPLTIAIDNTRVFVGGTARDAEGVQQFSLRCYDRETGDTLWQSNAAIWPFPVDETTVPTSVVDLVIDGQGLLHALPLQLNQALNPHVHAFHPATGAVLDRYTALTITPEANIAERFLAIGGDGRSYISAPQPNIDGSNTRGLAALTDGALVLAGTNTYTAGPGPDIYPLNILDGFTGSGFSTAVRRHSFVDPDGPGNPHSDFEAMGGVCADGADLITFTGGPIWNPVGETLHTIGQYDRNLNQLWTRPGQFRGPIACNPAGRFAAVMNGNFQLEVPPIGQGPRMPSLAVLTADGSIEWSHFHGDILTSDVAVAPDGWVATCGPLRPAFVREWDFLDSLLGT